MVMSSSRPGSRHNTIYTRFLLQKKAFDLQVDIEFPGSGITAVFGHSGSGKTTFLRCIAGLESIEQGTLIVNGSTWQSEKACLPTHKRPLGFVFQEASLFPHLSARGNINYALKRNKNKNGAIYFNQIIALLGIEPLLDHMPVQLSGGERQRVAIARALLIEPQILLMDEPLASLDYARKQEIMPYLERIRTELDIPIIYVSHSPEEISRLADHVLVMDQGRIITSGPLQETLSRIDFPLQLGEDTGVVLDAEIIDYDPGWGLVQVRFSGGSLWLRDTGLEKGNCVRVRVLARDISLSLSCHEDSSILNRIQGTITDIAQNNDKALALVEVQCGDSKLLARVTRRSIHQLQLQPGTAVWVQVKSAALIK